jgi:hypothetical protein
MYLLLPGNKTEFIVFRNRKKILKTRKIIEIVKEYRLSIKKIISRRINQKRKIRTRIPNISFFRAII